MIILQNIKIVNSLYKKRGLSVEMPLKFKVDEENAGLRLDLLISDRYPDISRSKIQKAIEKGLVLLDGAVPKKRVVPLVGANIEIDNSFFNQSTDFSIDPQDIPLDIIWEDEHYAAINKPAGLVVHPGNGNRDSTLVNALLYHLKDLSSGSASERPGIVHRLDKSTSGIIMVAKNDNAHQLMGNLFQEREIKKEYTGFCIGRRPDEAGQMDGSIGRSKNDPVKFCVTPTGKNALTEYKLEAFKDGISLLNFRLHTGRTHQIRVHCSHTGFSILQDELYGGEKKKVQNMEPLQRIFAYKVYKCFERQALHARRLSFVHPITKKSITLEAPYPADFEDAIRLFENEGFNLKEI